jgi:AsmA protein
VSKRRWFLGAAAALVLLPLAAAATAIALLDPDDYKPQLAAAVKEATGRTLTLGGKLRISRSLWPTIEANDVQLANLPGGSRADMARAEQIQAQLSLPALLWRRIEIIKLTLIGPNILFEQVDGKPNWVFDDAAEPAPAAPHDLAPHASLGFRTVHVQNGMVTFKLPARTKVVGIRSLDSAHPRENGPLDVAAVLVYSDNAPFSLRATAQPTAGLKDPWNTQLDFAAFGATASAKGTMNLTGEYDLQLDGQAPALEKLNALLPQMQLPALHGLTVSTHISNGPVRGDLPVIGTAQLHFASADLGAQWPGLTLGTTDMALPKAGGTAAIAGTGRYAGQAFKLAGNFGVPAHLDGRVSTALDLTATATGAKAAGSVAIKGKLALNTLRFAGLDATVGLRTPDLASFRPVVSPQLPALTNVAVDARVVLPANLSAATVHDAKLTAHAVELTGDVTLGLGRGLVLDGKLQAARLDMDAMMTAFGVTAAAKQSPDGTVIPDTALPWAFLRGPAIDLQATIDALDFAQQTWRGLEISVRLKAGRLQLTLPNAAFTADATTDTVPVSLTLNAPQVPLAVITRGAGLPGAVQGTLRLEAQLHAAGRSLHDLAAALDGSVAATMVGGSISNAALIQMTEASLQALSIQVPPQGQTAIRCLGVIGTFNKGVGRFKTIALNTTYLELDGAGQVDLGAETIALKLHPLAQLSGSSVSVPVLVEGPFRAVKGRLDASGLDKLGLLIDAWFGGDKPETCTDAGLVPAKSQ